MTLRSNAAAPTEGGLFGFQVFVVEDELVVSIMLEDMLAEFGCIVAGMAATVDDAMAQIVATPMIDAAILDVNLGGETIFPVADVLAARQIPFVFSTGYPSAELTRRYPSSRILAKPYASEALAEVLTDFLYDAPH